MCFHICINKCLEICTKNKKDFDQKIAHILLCKELYREVLNSQKQLKEVSEGLDRLQDDDTTVKASVEMWFDLINNKELEPLKNKTKKIIQRRLEAFHFIATRTDSKHSQMGLNPG